MGADVGIKDFLAASGVAISSAQRMQAVVQVASVIPRDPAVGPPRNAYSLCDVAYIAIPRGQDDVAIAAAPAARQPAMRRARINADNKRTSLIATPAGRTRKADEWRAAIQRQRLSYVRQKEHCVIFAITLSALRLQSGPLTLDDALEVRDRFITGFRAGWSLTALQNDLRTTHRGHEGVSHMAPAVKARKIAELKQIFDAAQRAPRPAVQPKQRAKAAAKPRAARDRGQARQRPNN